MASENYRATVSSKRKEGITPAEFSRRFKRHGEMVGQIVVKHNGISYIQHHVFPSFETDFVQQIGPELASNFTFSDADGIISLVFPTMKDLAQFFLDPAHADELNADVAQFADMESVRITIGFEHIVV